MMKIWVSVLLLAALVVTAVGANGGAQAQNDPLAFPHDANSVIVRWNGAPQATIYAAADIHPALGIQRLEVPDVAGALSALSANPNVLYVEPNYTWHAFDTIPNDPMFPQLWGMANIHAPAAWDITTGAATARVLTIDTGINYTHPDLAANIWVNPDEIAGNGIDDDGNGYVDDIHGINAITNTGNPADDHGHGSHVSGTMAGVGNNAVGVTGVNWVGQVAGCKFLAATGSGTNDNAVKCLAYAAAEGFNLSNNSWGGGSYSQALYDAIQYAGTVADHLFVVAAGNSNTTVPMNPCGYNLPNVLCVMATDSGDNRASFSNYGIPHVDIAAPGVGIWSTTLGSNYASWQGTSMATPHVAGLALLLRSQHPTWTWSQIKDHIMATGRAVPGLVGLSNTGMVIDAYAAVSDPNTPPLPTPGPSPTPGPTATPRPTMTPAPTVPPPPPPTPTPAPVPDGCLTNPAVVFGRVQGEAWAACYQDGNDLRATERTYGPGKLKEDKLEFVWAGWTPPATAHMRLVLRAVMDSAGDADVFKVLGQLGTETIELCDIEPGLTECSAPLPDEWRGQPYTISVVDTFREPTWKTADTVYIDLAVIEGYDD